MDTIALEWAIQSWRRAKGVDGACAQLRVETFEPLNLLRRPAPLSLAASDCAANNPCATLGGRGR